jgi:hypothetical protein
MEELAKIVTQMVIQSLSSINSSNNNMQQSQPAAWYWHGMAFLRITAAELPEKTLLSENLLNMAF